MLQSSAQQVPSGPKSYSHPAVPSFAFSFYTLFLNGVRQAHELVIKEKT